MTNENKYYVYAYLDPRKPGGYVYGSYSFLYEPFYIGKGCRHRHTQHLHMAKFGKREKNPKISKIKKLLSIGKSPIIVKVMEGLPEQKAFDVEVDLILKIGRVDLETGVLTNCNCGGKDSEISEKERRIRILNGQKKKPNMAGENNPMYGVHRFGENSPHYGRPHTQETKKFFYELHKGKRISEKTEFKKGHRTWNIGAKGLQTAWNKGINGEGKEYIFLKDRQLVTIKNLFQFCKKNSLSYSAMNRLHSFGYAHAPKKSHYTSRNYYKGYSKPKYE